MEVMAKPKNDAPDIRLAIPVGLTAAYIGRTNPAIGVDEANKLAEELHCIIYSYRSLFEARPPNSPGEHASDEVDAALTIWRTSMGWWMRGEGEEAEESCWLADRFDTMDPTEALYMRWLRLSDRICGGNTVEVLAQYEAEIDDG
jgi:hypothetical protein